MPDPTGWRAWGNYRPVDAGFKPCEATGMKRLLVIVLLVAGCGDLSTTDESLPFSLAAVRANFADECLDPIVVDEDFCLQIEIDGMSAVGDILNVPTGLNATARGRAQVICDQFAFVHYDINGDDLGYKIIGILDKDGGHAAACTVD
jgi:hypothetical protein